MQKLLIADDDNEIRELLEFDLSHSGYIVDSAKDGEEALQKALENNYDLILLDVMMPKMNGFDVCQNIRSSKPKLGDIELFPDSLETQIKNKKIKLTPTEFEILYCLMQHFNKAVTLAILLNEVWGYNSDDDVRMLRVHVGGLRQKIEENPKIPDYLHTVTNVGYKLTPFGNNSD